MREQVRDWYRAADAKRGAKQGSKWCTLDVTTCFSPLLRWVVHRIPAPCRHRALAIDTTIPSQRGTIRSIPVLINGCAIPIAWKVVGATPKGAWRPHWEALFGHLQDSVPPDWQVIVAADSGDKRGTVAV